MIYGLETMRKKRDQDLLPRKSVMNFFKKENIKLFYEQCK